MDASTIRCLITAGPTREHLDPVRYFSNGSSGKMGYALAAAARDRGWTVDLVTGPVALAPPANVAVHRVVSAEEMHEAAARLFAGCDVAILCAAVADFRPVSKTDEKRPKPVGRFFLEMEPTVDIARSLGAAKDRQLVVGFAAETDDLEARAEAKMAAKNFDWIVANSVGGADSAMESDQNKIVLIRRDGHRQRFGPALKTEVARFILDSLGLDT